MYVFLDFCQPAQLYAVISFLTLLYFVVKKVGNPSNEIGVSYGPIFKMSRIGKNGNLIVGLDLGTTKTCAIVGEVHNGGIDVIGFASVPSKGLRKGMVINIESTVDSISKVIEEAELMSGCKISAVYTGIAGSHIN